MILPYILNKYRINHTSEFVENVCKKTNNGISSLLDAKNLFTNVLIKETVEMIWN